MALDNYTNLKAEIALWLNRQDLTSVIPTFITLLEAQVGRDLRVREMLTSSTGSLATTGIIACPADFAGVHELTITDTSGPRVLEYASMDEVDRARHERDDVTDTPRLYTIRGSDIVVAPLPDDTYAYTLWYYQKIPALSDAAPTNWFLTKHPDVYLYGSLMQAAPFLHNDERISVWGAALGAILEQIRLADERETRGRGPLKLRFRPYGGKR